MAFSLVYKYRIEYEFYTGILIRWLNAKLKSSGYNLYDGGFQGCLNVLSVLLRFPLLAQFTYNGDLLTAEEIAALLAC